ncbi:hypothetical protein [Streptomyces sp. GESEQ-35]|uniref:hypothetical protein n=1 Tax=Streptomyces sp. GESEQ-35 TaxID=2812657 RepID=UPI001B33B126|nr:hypothetical protein [Streptomyces sp. GESEQ-35]
MGDVIVEAGGPLPLISQLIDAEAGDGLRAQSVLWDGQHRIDDHLGFSLHIWAA